MRINFGVWTLILSMISLGAFGQDYRYDIYLDSDANAGTGCTVATPAGTVAGVEARVRADITNVTVTGSTVALCQAGSFPAGGNLPAPYAVGLNNGTAGSDVIEMATPATLAPAGSNVPVHVVGWNGAATASDILSTTTGVVGGPPIIVGFPVVNIPTLGLFGFGLMILVLAVFGLKRLRTAARASLAAIGLLSVAGAVWAAGFSADGQVVDWNGVSPIATDPAADGSTADTGIDLRALFVGFENGTMFVRIDVTDVENQPPVANPVALTLLEDAAPQVITLSATDADGDPLTFAVQTNPTRGTLGAVTPVNTTSATVTYTVTPNANGADSFTYVANDGFVNSAPATVSLTITPVNDAPVFTAQNPPTVLEDSGAQTASVVTGLSAGPADESGQTIAFTITGNTNAALFAAPPTINAAGVLSYTPAPNANGTAQITFTAQDNGGTANGGVDTSAPGTVTVTVTAVNDAPVFTAGANQTVLEDAGATTVAGWATGISPGPADEAGQVLTFNVTANTNPALFSAAPAIDPATGTLTFTPAANANGAATLTVTLSDNGGTANGGVNTSAGQTFTITVTAVNDAPSFTSGGNVTVLKDLGPSTFPGWATAISAGPVDEAGQVLTFEVVNNTNAALFSTAPAVNATNGNLTFAVAANANGTATITLRLRDNGGTTNGGVDVSANQLFDIIVTAVNDAPSFTPGPNQTVNEDAGAQIVPTWATAILAGPPDEIGQVLTFNVTNNTNAALFSTPPAVNPANGNLTYTPAADANGTATITLTLSDDGGTANGGVDTSAPVNFTITVNAVNDAPSFTAQNAPAVNEDAGPQTATVATAISAGPANESGQTVTLSITGNTNAALFDGTPTIAANGELSYTPAANQSGAATLTIVAQDNGGTANGGIDTSAPQNVTVTVNAVNDAPVNTVAGPQTIAEDGTLLIPAAASIADADLGAGNMQVTLNGTNGVLTLAATAGLSFTVGDGTADATMTFTGALASVNTAIASLTFSPTANFAGAATITLVANDQGNTGAGGAQTDTDAISVTVTAVNDAPVNTVPVAQTVGTGATLAFNNGNGNAISVADVDSGAAPISTSILTTIGTLSATPVGASVTGNNSTLLTISGALADVNATLQTLAFTSATGGTGTISVNTNDNGNSGAGGAQLDSDSFGISVDSAPTVVSTTPANGAVAATTTNITVQFSEAVTVSGNWASLNCSVSGVRDVTSGLAVTDADPVFTLNPNVDLAPGESCTLTVVALQVTDDDAIDPPNTMVVDHVVAFTVDAQPTVSAVVPANGALNVPSNSTITLTFSESVDIASAAAFSVECPAATPIGFTVTTPALLPASATTFVLTPASALPTGVTCTVRVFATDVTDTDTIDPPQNMAADFTSTFATDAAPTVTGGAPANGATGVSTATTVTYTFSENVDEGPGTALTLECPAGNPIAGTVSGTGTSTLTFTPSAALPVGTACTATAVAANIGDTDTADPPNNLAVDVVRTFTTDAPPTVLSTNPANGASGVPGSNSITVNFSESVAFDTAANATNASFDLECPAATAADFTVVTASPATSVVLDPADAAIAGQTCTLIVRAGGITDADLGDPPNNMLLDFTASFSFAGVANDDAYTITPHLTFAAPVSVTGNDVLGAETITGFGPTLVTANDTVPNGTNFITAGGAGGRVVLNADGTFTAFPDAADDNLDGTVTFFYTLSGGDTAQVTLTFEAEEFTWFMDATPTTPVCTGTNLGTQACPADEFADFSSIDTANDVIFIDSGNYTGTVTLENTQLVIGNGSTSTLSALVAARVTPVAGSSFAPYNALNGAAPVLGCTNATCMTLGTGNTLRGFEIGNSGASGTDLAGTNFGTLTVDETSLSGTGRALNLATGTLAGAGFTSVASTSSPSQGINLAGIAGTLDLGSTTISGATTQGIQVGTSTANIGFGNTTVAAGQDCVSLQNNSAGTRTFGTLTLNGCGTTGFAHNAAGGAVTVTGATNITNVTGTGVAILGNTSPLTFNGILVNKAATIGNGIVISGSSGAITTGVIVLTISAGTGLSYDISSGGLTIAPTSTIVTNAGPAIMSSGGQGWNASFGTLSVVGSPTTGIDLANITGTITATGGAITGTGGVAFRGSGTLGTVSYTGPISKTTAGDLVNISAGASGNVTLSGQLTCNTVCTGIDVTGRSGGSYTFSGANSTISTGGNIAVNLDNNAGATIAFTGGNLNLATTTQNAFNVANGAASVTVTGTGNIVSTTGGRAISVVGSTIGAAGLNFQSVSANGGVNGIVLDNTGASGGLTITGSGSTTQGGDNSGGVIQNTSGDAILLSNTRNVSLTNIRVTNIGANPGDQAGAIDATNLAGTNLLQASTLTNLGKVGGVGGTNRNGLNVINTNTVLTGLTVNNNVFSDSDGTSSFLFTSARGTSSMNVTVTNNDFSDLVALAVQINAGDSETGAHVVTSNVTGNVFRAASPADGQGGLAVVNADDAATHNLTVANNTLIDLIKGIAGGNAEILLAQTTGGALNGTISGNTLGNAAFANGDRRGIGVIAEPDISVNGENGTVDIIHDNNSVDRLIDREAIFVDLREDTGNSELIVRNNRLGQLGGFTGQIGGIREALDIQTRGEVTRTFNTHVTNNLITANTSVDMVNLEVNIDNATPGNLTMHSTVTNNTLNNTGAADEIVVRPRDAGAVTTLCLDMSGNTVGAGAGIIELNETGVLNVEQNNANQLASANGIPNGNVTITGTAPTFNVTCLVPPT